MMKLCGFLGASMIGSAVFGVLLVAAAYADPIKDCAALLPNGIAPVYMTAPPSHHTELCHAPAFVLSHDDDAHEPRWVAWAVTADHLKTDVGRTDDFRLDPDLPPGAGAKPSDYAGAHEDKGHQANAEDNGWSEETEHLSFLMSNMIPQCPPCNEQAYRYVENWTRALAKKRGEVFVIAGPVFGPNPSKIGKSGVWVPVASWKLVVDLAANEAWGFIVPNVATQLKPGTDISAYLVTPHAVELAAGLALPVPKDIKVGSL